MKQKIITIGLGEELHEGLAAGIDQQAAEVLSVPSWRFAWDLYENVGVDLVVMVPHSKDMFSDELAVALAAPSSPRLVIIAGEDDHRMLSEHASSRLVVLKAGLPASELVSVCRQFIRTAPRIGQRLMARLEVKTEAGAGKLRMVQIQDLSASGMRVATSDLLPCGTWVVFTFNWPGDPDPVSGDAEVKRHTSKEADGIAGMGIHFTSFEGQGGLRLREHIRQNLDLKRPSRFETVPQNLPSGPGLEEIRKGSAC